MELWEMTFKQFREHLLENNKYKKTYEQKPEIWERMKKDHLSHWEKILSERAEIGSIPSDVLISFIRIYGEEYLFRLFKGTKAKGIQDFRIPKSIREGRINVQ